MSHYFVPPISKTSFKLFLSKTSNHNDLSQTLIFSYKDLIPVWFWWTHTTL